MKELFKNKIFRYTGIIIVLLLWELLPRISLFKSNFFPTFSSVILELGYLAKKKYLFMNLMVSLWRIVIGLMISTFTSIILGLNIGFFYRKFSDRLIPLLRIFSQINPYSIFPLFIVFLGVGEKSRIGIVVWVSMWPLMFHTLSAGRNIDASIIKSAMSMTTSKLILFSKVILPASIPNVFQGIRASVEMAFFILTAAEMSGATAGLGYLIHNAGMNYFVTQLYASGLCIVVISVLINLFLVDLKERIYFWKDDNKTKVKRIGKSRLIVITCVLLLILIVGSFEVKKAYDFQNDPKNGFSVGLE